MAYLVKIKTGSGKDKCRSGSIPLPNKQRIINYIKRSSLVNPSSRICVENTRTGKTICGDSFKFSKDIKGKFRF